MRAIISQRLVPSVDGARLVAVEVMLDTPRIKDLIKQGEVNALKEAMEQAVNEGCQTFDQALFTLYKEGKITIEQALMNADSANNLRLKIKLDGPVGEEAVDKLMSNSLNAGNQGGLTIKDVQPSQGNFRRL